MILLTIQTLLHHLAAIDDVDALLQVAERGCIHLATVEAVDRCIDVRVGSHGADAIETVAAKAYLDWICPASALVCHEEVATELRDGGSTTIEVVSVCTGCILRRAEVEVQAVARHFIAISSQVTLHRNTDFRSVGIVVELHLDWFINRLDAQNVVHTVEVGLSCMNCPEEVRHVSLNLVCSREIEMAGEV